MSPNSSCSGSKHHDWNHDKHPSPSLDKAKYDHFDDGMFSKSRENHDADGQQFSSLPLTSLKEEENHQQ